MTIKNHNHNLIYGVLICLLAVSFVFSGCKGSATKSTGSVRKVDNAPVNVGVKSDDFSDYVKESIDSVKGPETTMTPTPYVENSRVVDVEVDDIPPRELYVSSSEGLTEDSDYTPNFSTEERITDSDDESDDEETEDEEDEELSPAGYKITPDEFEVGKCCIYINGAIDEQYGADIITALNKARTDLGYTALEEKKGLDTCADRRTREIASFLSHTRPNALPFYSLAPEYFKAEMLAIDGAKPEETIDAWIRDPYSRSLVFSEKFTSVGAACFKCNTLNCVVVALGY